MLKKRLGEGVRLERKRLGLSLKKLGDEIGVSAPQLFNIESGDSFPSFVVYEALVRRFGLGSIPLVRFRPKQVDFSD